MEREEGAIAMVSIAGQRHRHRPSIGVRNPGIGGFLCFAMARTVRDADVDFFIFNGTWNGSFSHHVQRTNRRHHDLHLLYW
jgi:hypothetical protein